VKNQAAVELCDRRGFAPHGVEPRTSKIDGRYYDTELRIPWLKP
jgi:hypothetical protein